MKATEMHEIFQTRVAVALLGSLVLIASMPEMVSAGGVDADPMIQGVTLSATPLSVAIERLRQASGKPLSAVLSSSEEVFLADDTPVTAHLSNLRLSEAVKKLMTTAGGESIKWNLGSDGVIRVTALSINEKSRVDTRTYDVTALIGNASEGPKVDQLVSSIRGIAPATWKETGGPYGSVRCLTGWLIVTQTPDAHELIKAEISASRSDIMQRAPKS